MFGSQYYRTVLSFQRSTFLQTLFFENFIETILKICASSTHNNIVSMAYKPGQFILTRTVPSHCRPLELTASSKAMPISNVSS